MIRRWVACFMFAIGIGSVFAGSLGAQTGLRGWDWVTRELKEGAYELNSFEKSGTYLCSIYNTTIVGVSRGDGLVMFTLQPDAPMTVRENELSEELRNQIEEIDEYIKEQEADGLAPTKRYRILCVHPAFRRDWQDMRDRDGFVYPRILRLIPQE